MGQGVAVGGWGVRVGRDVAVGGWGVRVGRDVAAGSGLDVIRGADVRVSVGAQHSRRGVSSARRGGSVFVEYDYGDDHSDDNDGSKRKNRYIAKQGQYSLCRQRSGSAMSSLVTGMCFAAIYRTDPTCHAWTTANRFGYIIRCPAAAIQVPYGQ